MKSIVLTIFIILLNTFSGFSQEIQRELPNVDLNIKTNKTVQSKSNDTLSKPVIKNNKSLENEAHRSAKGYEKLNQLNKTITLYDKAVFKYGSYELKAGIIVYNYETEELYAGRIKDSLGKLSQIPEFKEGKEIVTPDSIRFNLKSKKAIVWNSRTTYDEFNIKAEKTKRINDSVYYMSSIKFTTAKDVDNPEYYFRTKKLKYIHGKKIVTGPTQMVIADVPTPFILPFAFFPITKKAVSGFIVPSFGESTKGYYLQGGGYYFALSDNYDLTLLGDYYTNGSYAFSAQSTYAKRYKYNGNLNIRLENNLISEIGFPDYEKRKTYNLQWTHSQNQKASPSSRFSASVNLGSSSYFRNSLNQQNIGANLNNIMTSSISYTKNFETSPKITTTISTNHSQNVNTKRIDLTLPNINTNIERIYPFAPKSGAKKGFIKNINLQYSVNGKNQIQTTDSLFFKKQMFKDMKTGMVHNIPIATNFKLLKYFSVSMSGNYKEVWTLNTIKKVFDPIQNKVITENKNDFDSFRQYNFTTGIGTTLYGTFVFGKNSKIQAIRHQISPKINYSYTPSFEEFYDTYAIDAQGTTMQEYTRFQGGLFGTPNKSLSNMLSLNVSNNLEAKIRDDESDTGKPKKIKLLNSFNFSTNYNMTADSLKLAPIRVNAGISFFDRKLGLNMGTTLDPYTIDINGKRINTWNIMNKGSLLRMTSANLNLNYSFSSKDGVFNKSESVNAKQNEQNGGRTDDLFGQSINNQQPNTFTNEGIIEQQKWYNNSIPWDLNLAYSLTYKRNNRIGLITNNSLMFSGNVSLSPGWRVGFSSGYDFKNMGVTHSQIRFQRDLKSWHMSFSWVPTGYSSQWNFFIGIKSTILQDIKYEKRRTPDKTYN